MSAARDGGRPDAAAGFTLLETLVALTLVALLVAGVLQAVRWVGVASSFGQRAERATQVQAGATALTDLLAGALPPAPGGAAFLGDATTFSFDGVSDGTALPPGRVRVSIGHQRNATGGAIVATLRPASGGTVPEGAPSWTSVLIDGVPNARFSYFGRAGGRGPGGWTPGWTDATAMPSLVLLDLSLDGIPTLPRLPLYARLGRSPAAPGALPGD